VESVRNPSWAAQTPILPPPGTPARLETRHGRQIFELQEIVAEVTSFGTHCAESTIRTHVTSRICSNAPDNHAVVYNDLVLLDRGRYRRA